LKRLTKPRPPALAILRAAATDGTSHFAWRARSFSYMRLRWRGAERPRAANFSGRRHAADRPAIVTGTGGMTNPFVFIQQVRAEAAKVVWPTRRETLVTTGLVLLLVAFASIFFTVVDEVLRVVVGLALGIGRGG
jgi:preprotein translocase subunit SecE